MPASTPVKALEDPDKAAELVRALLAESASNRRRRFNAVVRWAILLMVLPVLLFGYWTIRPYSKITLTPFQTDRVVYLQGDIVTMRNKFCYEDITFISFRFFANSTVKVSAGTVEIFGRPDPTEAKRRSVVATPGAPPAAASAAPIDSDGCVISTVRIQVPDTLPPNTSWRIVYEVAYKANPIRTIHLSNASNEFLVLPAKESS